MDKLKSGRGGGIRTHDLIHPMDARYQTALRPESFPARKISGYPCLVIRPEYAEDVGVVVGPGFGAGEGVDLGPPAQLAGHFA